MLGFKKKLIKLVNKKYYVLNLKLILNLMDIINDKQQFAKDTIAILADKAKENIIQNKYLLEKIYIFKQQILEVKNLITEFSINSNQKNINNKIATKYKEKLTLLNSHLKGEIDKVLSKQKIIHKNSINELSIENKILSQLSIDNFILKNTLIKLNNDSFRYNLNLKSIKEFSILANVFISSI